MNKPLAGERRSWRQEPLVWMLIAVPLAAVIMGIVTLVLAIRSYDGLVSDDYYQRGLEINRAIERDARAAGLGLTAELGLSAAEGRVRVTVRASEGFAPPPTLDLKFAYALSGTDDRDLTLAHAGGTAYETSLPPLKPGRWYVQLSGTDWRLKGVVRLPEQTRVRLEPVR